MMVPDVPAWGVYSKILGLPQKRPSLIHPPDGLQLVGQSREHLLMTLILDKNAWEKTVLHMRVGLHNGRQPVLFPCPFRVSINYR